MMKEYVLSIHLGDVKFYVYDFGFELILFFWLIRVYFWVLMALHSLFELKKNNNN